MRHVGTRSASPPARAGRSGVADQDDILQAALPGLATDLVAQSVGGQIARHDRHAMSLGLTMGQPGASAGRNAAGQTTSVSTGAAESVARQTASKQLFMDEGSRGRKWDEPEGNESPHALAPGQRSGRRIVAIPGERAERACRRGRLGRENGR